VIVLYQPALELTHCPIPAATWRMPTSQKFFLFSKKNKVNQRFFLKKSKNFCPAGVRVNWACCLAAGG
jgi:hypothetical protein